LGNSATEIEENEKLLNEASFDLKVKNIFELSEEMLKIECFTKKTAKSLYKWVDEN
jgi:hypothetical protein